MQIQPGNQNQEKEVKSDEKEQDQEEDLAKQIPTVTPDNLDPLPDQKDEE